MVDPDKWYQGYTKRKLNRTQNYAKRKFLDTIKEGKLKAANASEMIILVSKFLKDKAIISKGKVEAAMKNMLNKIDTSTLKA